MDNPIAQRNREAGNWPCHYCRSYHLQYIHSRAPYKERDSRTGRNRQGIQVQVYCTGCGARGPLASSPDTAMGMWNGDLPPGRPTNARAHLDTDRPTMHYGEPV